VFIHSLISILATARVKTATEKGKDPGQGAMIKGKRLLVKPDGEKRNHFKLYL
jgi:hypothetical protein